MWKTASLSLLPALAVAAGNGRSTCQCRWEFPETPEFQWKQGPRSGFYDADTYGKGCAAHDKNQAPYCTGSNPPSFCEKEWCFVDATNCDQTIGRSMFNSVGNQLYYSYTTCGSSDSWSNWQAGDSTIRQLHTTVDQNLIVLRDQMEAEAEVVNSAQEALVCQGPSDLCKNRPSGFTGGYPKTVDLRKAGMWLNMASDESSREEAKCLFEAGDDKMVRLGSQEQDSDGTKRAYIYAGDQGSGSLLQWPDMESFCPADPGMKGYDARLRPWYSTGLTSPKDVMIVVDVSGSMGLTDGSNEERRSQLAKAAVKAILRTVTFKDFVNIILFNNDLANQFSDLSVPATEENVQAMLTWVDSGSGGWQNGGTNFGAALDATFDIFKASRSAGASSYCQKIVLFLTDGKDDTFTDFAGVQRKATETGMVIMTYSLGEGADNDEGASTMKQLACDNNGIFYRVKTGDDIANIMAKYYDYFTKGQQICTSSATRYTDVTGDETYTACMPMYNEHGLHGDGIEDGLFHPLGVVCYDYNLIESIETISKQSDWENFVCAVSDITKKCQILDYDECHLQKLRRAVTAELNVEGYDAVCPGTETGEGNCKCADPECKDSETYRDPFGYYCDGWVGDDCNKIMESFDGYTQETVNAIKAQCKRSCGLCEKSEAFCESDKRSCPQEANSYTATCRACAADKTTTGVGIDGLSMCCPGERSQCTAAEEKSGSDDKSDGAAELKALLPMLAILLAV